MFRLWKILLLATIAFSLWAQNPTGTISGTVTDETGAVVPNAKVTITNKASGAARDLVSGTDGSYSAPALPAGDYEVRVETTGFRVLVSQATVQTGGTTTVNAVMQVGANVETVNVESQAANINYDTNTIQGVVTRAQIEDLPLNGRNFLNLAQLEPGVIVTPANPAQFNAQFSVSILGGPASRTEITVDGASIRNPVEGGTGMNFSQEVVQEFQISSTNFDLSTGITAFGAVNIVSRSGTNDFHGVGYMYYRDHNISAYPSLNRNPITDDPFFVRKQPGAWLGGPIKKDKLFFFANYEYTFQKGVYVVQPDLVSLSNFLFLAPAPYSSDQYSIKLDYHMSDKESLFLRFSHDGNSNQGPFGVAVPPSNFVANRNRSNQAVLGITSVLTPSLVNDFRYSFWYWQNRNSPAPCTEGSVECLGAGGPEVHVITSNNFVIGNNFNSPQGRIIRRFPLQDNMNWTVGSHRTKFGGIWEYQRGVGYWAFADPAVVYLWSPEILTNIPIGGGLSLLNLYGFNTPLGQVPHLTASQLNQLPLYLFYTGIGAQDQPAPYKIQDAIPNNRLHFYFQDNWKVSPKFTLNYGLGWEFESNVLNYDLPRPSLVTSLYGGPAGSEPKKNYRNFEPALGFAWSPRSNGKTVVRGGVGIFYDTQEGWWRLGERAVLGPNGRQFIYGSAIQNPSAVTGLLGTVPAGAPIDFEKAPSSYTYGNFLQQLPTILAQENALFPGTGTSPQILLSKQAGALGALYPYSFPTLQSQHFNLGIQHEIAAGLVVQADFVYRHTIHETPGGFFGASVDYNHYQAVNGPAIPRCASQSQVLDPNAICSTGSINFWYPGGTSAYRALLLKVDKRFAKRYQLTASYAFQNSQSINDVTANLYNYFASYGPDQAKHVLNISSIVDLPLGFQLSFVSAVTSPPPVEPTIGSIDISGSGATYTPLPGEQYNGWLTHSKLQQLVQQYNTNYAGMLTPLGQSQAAAGSTSPQRFPALTLPAHYNLGHDFSSQDVRLTKIFKAREHYELRIFGEVFNIFNFGNLTGDNFSLTSPTTFGQPTQRVGQTFGSGGPRAFQVGGRFYF